MGVVDPEVGVVTGNAPPPSHHQKGLSGYASCIDKYALRLRSSYTMYGAFGGFVLPGGALLGFDLLGGVKSERGIWHRQSPSTVGRLKCLSR